MPVGLQDALETETTLDLVYEEIDLISDLAVTAEVDSPMGGLIINKSGDATVYPERIHVKSILNW